MVPTEWAERTEWWEQVGALQAHGARSRLSDPLDNSIQFCKQLRTCTITTSATKLAFTKIQCSVHTWKSCVKIY